MDLIIKNLTIDDFRTFDYDDNNYLIGTGRVDEAEEFAPVRHAHWEKTGAKRYYSHNDMVYVDFELKCSCCGKIKWMSEQQQPIDNYCPNCGAKMDE